MENDNPAKIQVLTTLAQIQDPATGRSLVEGNTLQRVDVQQGQVSVLLHYQEQRPKNQRWPLEDEIYALLEKLPQVTNVTIDVQVEPSLDKAPALNENSSHEPRKKEEPSKPEQTAPSSASAGKPQKAPQKPATHGIPPKKRVEGVKAILAVASGKGGVGKSTVACNLALALAKRGHSIGLLDIDIYGPSLPTLFGLHQEPMIADGMIEPLHAHGLRLMSLGFLMKDDQPVIWRGPLVGSVVRQFLYEVNWRQTDYLVVDLPPGTGDAQLTLAQSVPIDGVAIVTTPSDLALVDAARGIHMFRALNVEVLGVIENMAYFVCPTCQTTHHIFGDGGPQREADRLGTRLLGGIPLDGELRRLGDNGRPIVLADESAPSAQAFLELARAIEAQKPLPG
ncbi:MAG: P-loop NTPase [Bradymonadales bacterium]|nr:P-loop NTPase [Bradymonadales bacterium]